jgi:hypothetical protein
MNPPYKPSEPDRNTVRIMAACGVSQEDIAKCIGSKGISEPTLRKHFKRELEVSYHQANAQIAAKLFQAANNGEGWAVCFWLKCRARWQEVVRYEHAGVADAPLQVDVTHGETDPKAILRSRIAGLAARLNPGSGSSEPE